ncbi:MAG: cytochrome C [Conexivisphaerales archaeon]
MIAGLVTGLWAAIAVGIFAMNIPEAFGICGISHPRDMIDFVFNKLLGTNFFLSNYSLVIPVLTYVGIVLGAAISAYQKKELRLRSVPDRASPVIYGFAVANFGMLMGFCSVRAVMLLAYGNLLAVPGLIGILIGVVVACRFVKWRVKARD